MSKISLILLSFISLNLFASTNFENVDNGVIQKRESFVNSQIVQEICFKSKQGNKQLSSLHYSDLENYYIANAANDGSEVFVFSLDSQNQIASISINQRITQIKSFEQSLFVLTQDRIYEYSKENFQLLRSVPSFKENQSYEQHQSAYALSIDSRNGFVFVAHGSLGVMKYSLESLELIDRYELDLPQSNPRQISMATGIDNNQDGLYVAIDNHTYDFGSKKRAFEGVIVLGANDLSLKSAAKINQNKEAYHLPIIYAFDGHVVTKNLFLLFKYPVKRLNKRNNLKPSVRAWNFGLVGELLGKPFADSKNFYGCYKHVNEGHEKNIGLVINRKKYKL